MVSKKIIYGALLVGLCSGFLIFLLSFFIPLLYVSFLSLSLIFSCIIGLYFKSLDLPAPEGGLKIKRFILYSLLSFFIAFILLLLLPDISQSFLLHTVAVYLLSATVLTFLSLASFNDTIFTLDPKSTKHVFFIGIICNYILLSSTPNPFVWPLKELLNYGLISISTMGLAAALGWGVYKTLRAKSK